MGYTFSYYFRLVPAAFSHNKAVSCQKKKRIDIVPVRLWTSGH